MVVATEIEGVLLEAVQVSHPCRTPSHRIRPSAEYAVPAALASTASFGGATTAGAAGLARHWSRWRNSLAMRQNSGFMFGRTIVNCERPRAVRARLYLPRSSTIS